MGLGDLAGVIDEVSIGVDPVEIATAFALRDRLDAKIAEAVAAFDRAELWDEDGSVSMAAWLRANAGRTQRDAQRTATTARRLRALPGVAEAFASGSISGGVVDAIVGIVTERTLDLFARCERTMLSEIAGRPMHEVLRHLRSGRRTPRRGWTPRTTLRRPRSRSARCTCRPRWTAAGSSTPLSTLRPTPSPARRSAWPPGSWPSVTRPSRRPRSGPTP